MLNITNVNAKVYKLEALYDSAKSFYGKARVVETPGSVSLYSYDTLIAVINGGGFNHMLNKGGFLSLTDAWDASQTTARHLNEFLLQHGGNKLGANARSRKKVKEAAANGEIEMI